jgi:2-keto-4-pentenoate hydratase/2-oxohepta-3-ene-1,7-dioic acid hydratase in catechol pathway
MKLCRFEVQTPASENLAFQTQVLPGQGRHGVLVGGIIHEIEGEILGARNPSGRSWPINQIRLLPPVTPSKIVCVGRNYPEHAAELCNEIPKEPLIFFKPPSSVIGPEEPIRLPQISQRVDYEGELAAVIGRTCFQLSPLQDAQGFVAGYTCLNDVTARDLQKRDGQFTRAKSFDTFCPIGPVIETEFDFTAAWLETRVNGERRQRGRPGEMLFSVDVILRWITEVMTLFPGDVVALGTPPGVGPLRAGDVVEVEAGGVGILRNTVLAGVPATSDEAI